MRRLDCWRLGVSRRAIRMPLTDRRGIRKGGEEKRREEKRPVQNLHEPFPEVARLRKVPVSFLLCVTFSLSIFVLKMEVFCPRASRAVLLGSRCSLHSTGIVCPIRVLRVAPTLP